ncbi:MAG: hypothetical protein Q9195_000147 [Heterodermia aff. obscurata]
MNRAPTSTGRLCNFLHLCGKRTGWNISGSHTQLRLLEEGTTEWNQASLLVDAHTQTPDDWGSGSTLYDISDIQQQQQAESTNPSPYSDTGKQVDLLTQEDNPEASEPSEDHETQQPLLYPSSTRVVLVHDRVAFALTKETIDDLHQVILGSRSLKRCQAKFEEAKGKADIGQSYIEMAESQISNSKLPDHFREQVKQELEDSRAVILGDIQRKEDLEQELGIQACNVELQRGDMDDLFERMMFDAGIIDEADDSISVQDSQTNQHDPEANIEDNEGFYNDVNEVEHEGLAETGDLQSESSTEAQNDLNPKESEMDIAEREHTEAWNALQEASQQFDRREEAYNEDIAEHAGGGKYSRTEVDLFHYQLGAALTKDLREAEEELERTRARCEALGIQITSSTAGSEIFFDDQDYRESQDTAQNASRIDRDVIEKWVTQVAGVDRPSSDEPPSPSTEDMEWDAESVTMSDSCSTLAHNPKERKLILKYQLEQQQLRTSMAPRVDESAE